MPGSVSQRILLAIASCVLALTGTALGQFYKFIEFEPPNYVSSPSGVPLAGQDLWYTPVPFAQTEWHMYSNGNNTLGVPHNIAGLTGVAAGFVDPNSQDPIPVAIQRNVYLDGAPYVQLTIDILVDHVGALPAGDVIGRISMEPELHSSSFAIVPRWVDANNPGQWIMEFVHYTEKGELVQSQPGSSSNLESGVWYDVWMLANFVTGKFDGISVRKKSTGQIVSSTNINDDWYLRGGSTWQGYPSAFRLSVGDGEHAGALLAADNYDLVGHEYPLCYQNCNRDSHINILDFICYGDYYAAGHPYADCDESGTLNIVDYICFGDRYAMGCGP